MKILQANAGALTNFEVLDFLRSRGAGKDATRVMLPIAPSEFKVFDYLEETAACNQTREIIANFSGNCKKFNLAKAEILNIINVRPSSLVEIFPIIEEYETRFGESGETMEELVETINNTLPAPPMPIQPDEQVGEEEEEETAPNADTVETTK